MDGLTALFSSTSIAIVGVSEDPAKLGSVILSNLLSTDFAGKVYPVNPKYQKLYDLACYPTVSAIPEPVDTVCIVVPQPAVKAVVEDAAQKSVKSAIIITAGFGEAGTEGKALEQEIATIARKAGMRILGPNCLGVITPRTRINLSFAALNPLEGNIAFMSQSGAFCTAMLDMSLPKNVGFSHFVSLGNKVDINEIELLKYFQNDPTTKVIAAYLEEITDGLDFVREYDQLQNPKPFIIFKPGRSNEAKQAISSHTGSIAGSTQMFQTAVTQHGIMSATSMREMFNLMMGFSWIKALPVGRRVAVVTNAGGPGIIATDEVIAHNLQMAHLADSTHDELAKLLPATANIHNPIDVIGDALADRYQDALKAVLKDPNVDAVIVLLTPQLVTQIEETAKFIYNTAKLSNKPIIPVFIGGKYVTSGLQQFYNNKVAVYTDISDAIDVLMTMCQYTEWLQNRQVNPTPWNELEKAGTGTHHNELTPFLTQAATVLTETLTATLLEEVGIPVPKQKLCASLNEALEFAKNLYPVVVKAPNNAITHKTDMKAVYLNIANEQSLKKAYTELSATITSATKTTNPPIFVQQQLTATEELFIGVTRDGGVNVYTKDGVGFGHLLVFGKGGIYTEIYQDHGMTTVPATTHDILTALASTKVAQILTGARGKKPLAVDKLVTVIESIQKMVISYPEIVSLDINPLFITENDVWAVDTKIFVAK